MSRSLYCISWLPLSSIVGNEFTFESDPYDAIDVARANDGIITYQGEDYSADELLQQVTRNDTDNDDDNAERDLGMEFNWRIEA
jgi:hypothetical protein